MLLKVINYLLYSIVLCKFKMNPKLTIKNNIFLIYALIFSVISCFQFGFVNAGEITIEETEPLWEFGLFPGAIYMPHYRGSDEYKLWAMPLPYVIYRGKFFQLDREGVRGIFYTSKYLETSISGWGNPPVEDDNNARKGMDKLDPVVELGPSVKWYFTGRHTDWNTYFGLALRSVFSIGLPDDLNSCYRGIKTALNFIYLNDALFCDNRWQIGFNTGFEITDKKYNSYFYEVPPENSLPERPAYSPDGGFAGIMFSLRLIRDLNDKISAAGYGRWENVSWAVYKSSPLVKKDNNFIIGGAFIWTIKESKEMVKKGEYLQW